MKDNSNNLDSDKIQGKDTQIFDSNKDTDTTIEVKQTAENKLMVSQYKNFKIEMPNKNLLEIFDDIKSGKHKNKINSIRESLDKKDNETADKIKSGLLAFTTSGTFGESRTKDKLSKYSQILCLDYDHIPNEEIGVLREIINECNFTLASFKSPSGYGLKVFIQVNSGAEQHSSAYNQVANFYKVLSTYDFDEKCKDITRLCFVSWDEDLFLNENATIFDVQKETTQFPKEAIKKTAHSLSSQELLEKCLEFTEKKEMYYNGNRNNFIHLFSNNANRFGILESDTLDFCITNFDLDKREIKATVSSTYKNQIAEFAKFAESSNLQSNDGKNPSSLETNSELDIDILKETPLIPQFVYDNLPSILLDSCKVFTETRERDVYLTGALTILSGCLPNVSGLYMGSVVYPNLYSFILAPAASGKGVLKSSKALADKYHNKTLAVSLDDKKRYDENLAAFKTLKGKDKLLGKQAMPIAPKFKVVYIPANTSNAKIIQHLDCNQGKGIICETEADTLGQTLKNEWGSYSDLLRKAFHHEKISVSRKTDAEFIEVNNPRLSVALSGTPKQILNIISSAEDGLFSRFFFYAFKTDAIWQDPSQKGNPINITEYFINTSNQVLKMVEFFEREEMVLDFTEEQWKKFNSVFSSFLEETSIFVGDDALSVIKRLGLIFYRFCMIFTAIRKFSNNDRQRELFCSDIDFETALALITTYRQHSIIVFNNLPKQKEQEPFKSGQNKKHFFDALPKRFTRKEAIELGKQYNIAERTVGSLLKKCLETHLNQPEYGVYEKTLKIKDNKA